MLSRPYPTPSRHRQSSSVALPTYHIARHRRIRIVNVCQYLDQDSYHMIPALHPAKFFFTSKFGGAGGAICVGGACTSICVGFAPLGWLCSPGEFETPFFVNISVSLSPFDLILTLTCAQL